MNLSNLSGLEKMEVYLRTLTKTFQEFDVQTKMFPNSGIAVRTMKLKAGEVVLGKIHKEWNVNILASGSMYVSNDPTKDFVRVEAPAVFETGPESQKFVMCITDCVFMNAIISNNETEDELLNRMAKDTRITNLIKDK